MKNVCIHFCCVILSVIGLSIQPLQKEDNSDER